MNGQDCLGAHASCGSKSNQHSATAHSTKFHFAHSHALSTRAHTTVGSGRTQANTRDKNGTGSYEIGKRVGARLCGHLGEAQLVVAVVEHGVVLADEHVTQNPEWAWGEEEGQGVAAWH